MMKQGAILLEVASCFPIEGFDLLLTCLQCNKAYWSHATLKQVLRFFALSDQKKVAATCIYLLRVSQKAQPFSDPGFVGVRKKALAALVPA